MNEAGRPHGPTGAQSRSLVGVKLSSGQQVGHMNTSLTEWEKLGGSGKMKGGQGKCRNIKETADDRRKLWRGMKKKLY